MDPAPSIRGAAAEQEDILHVFAATKNYTPQSSSSAQLDASRSLILKEAHRLTLQHGKYIGTGFSRTPRLAYPLPPPAPSSVETASKCKTDESFKEKVIYIVESFRASRNLRFITWGTKPVILESSHSEGADVFYGK